MSLIKTALAAWKRMLRNDAIKNTGAFESKLVNSGIWNYDKEARGLLKGSLGKMRSAWGIPREKVKMGPKAYAEAYRSGVGLEHDRKFHEMLKANVTRQKNSPEFATKVKHVVRGNSLDIHPTYELGNSKKYIDSRFGGYKDFIDSDNKSHVLGIHGALTKHESHEGSAMFNRNSLLPRTLKADSISSAVKAPFNFLRKGRSDTARRGFATHFEPGVVFRESNDMMFLHPSVRIAERATRMMDGGATVYRGKLLNSKWNPKNWFSKPSTTSELDVLEKLHPGFRYGETHMSPKQIHKANQRYINKDFERGETTMSLLKTARAAWKRMLQQGAIKDTAAFESKLVDANIWNYDKEARGLLKGSLGRLRGIWGIPKGKEYDDLYYTHVKRFLKREHSPDYASHSTLVGAGRDDVRDVVVIPSINIGHGGLVTQLDRQFNKNLNPNNVHHVLGEHAAAVSHEVHELGIQYNKKNPIMPRMIRKLPHDVRGNTVHKAFDDVYNVVRKHQGLSSHVSPEVLYRESNDSLFLHPEVRKTLKAMRATDNKLRIRDKGPVGTNNFLYNTNVNPFNVTEKTVVESLAPGFSYGETYISPKQMRKATDKYINSVKPPVRKNPKINIDDDSTVPPHTTPQTPYTTPKSNVNPDMVVTGGLLASVPTAVGVAAYAERAERAARKKALRKLLTATGVGTGLVGTGLAARYNYKND